MIDPISAALDALRTDARAAAERGEIWPLLTAIGVDEASFETAEATVGLLSKIVDFENIVCVDIGAGIARHLMACEHLGARAVAVESSSTLRGLAQRLLKNDAVVTDSRALAMSLKPTVTMLMSDTLYVVARRGNYEGYLRNLSSQLSAGATVVTETTSPRSWPNAGTQVLGILEDLSVSETVCVQPSHVLRRYAVERNTSEYMTAAFEYETHSPDQLLALFARCGFHDLAVFPTRDGLLAELENATDTVIVGKVA